MLTVLSHFMLSGLPMATVTPQNDGGEGLGRVTGKSLNHNVKSSLAWRGAAIVVLAGLLTGCGGASDFLSKDAEWFSRPRLFNNDLSVGVAPLSQRKPVSPEDLVSADGLCLNMGAPEATDPNADPAAAAAAPALGVNGSVGIDSSECDVVRFAGVPTNTEVSTNERGERAVTLTYLGGPRPGIYRFTGGRLTSMERAPTPPGPPPRAQKRRT
jgi:hypothetical protein